MGEEEGSVWYEKKKTFTAFSLNFPFAPFYLQKKKWVKGRKVCTKKS